MSSSTGLSLAKEIVTILASNDDEDALENTRNALMQEVEERSRLKDEIAEAIRHLTVSAQEAEQKASQDDRSKLERLETLSCNTTAANKDIRGIENEIRSLGEELIEKEEGRKSLQGKHNEVDAEKDEVLPKIKYNFKLYTNISHIRWDYECEKDYVGGFVACLKDVKPFKLNRKQNTNYFIANYLWDLIETSQ